jgi:hypothetical protein
VIGDSGAEIFGPLYILFAPTMSRGWRAIFMGTVLLVAAINLYYYLHTTDLTIQTQHKVFPGQAVQHGTNAVVEGGRPEHAVQHYGLVGWSTQCVTVHLWGKPLLMCARLPADFEPQAPKRRETARERWPQQRKVARWYLSDRTSLAVFSPGGGTSRTLSVSAQDQRGHRRHTSMAPMGSTRS